MFGILKFLFETWEVNQKSQPPPTPPPLFPALYQLNVALIGVGYLPDCQMPNEKRSSLLSKDSLNMLMLYSDWKKFEFSFSEKKGRMAKGEEAEGESSRGHTSTQSTYHIVSIELLLHTWFMYKSLMVRSISVQSKNKVLSKICTTRNVLKVITALLSSISLAICFLSPIPPLISLSHPSLHPSLSPITSPISFSHPSLHPALSHGAMLVWSHCWVLIVIEIVIFEQNIYLKKNCHYE